MGFDANAWARFLDRIADHAQQIRQQDAIIESQRMALWEASQHRQMQTARATRDVRIGPCGGCTRITLVESGADGWWLCDACKVVRS